MSGLRPRPRAARSLAVAYVLWLLVGGLGGHRFYLGRTGSGVAQLCLLMTWPFLLVGIGFVTLGVLGLWLITDLFLIPGMAREANSIIARRG